MLQAERIGVFEDGASQRVVGAFGEVNFDLYVDPDSCARLAGHVAENVLADLAG